MQPPPLPKLFVEGRYRKLARDLPQTIFFCPDCRGHERRRHGCKTCEGFGKLARESVQELITWVLGKAAGTRKTKFHGAGREDVDVRMLGTGRPFVIELADVKFTAPNLAEVEATINARNEGRLEVQGLHWTQKGRVRALKEGEFAKEYRALVEATGPVDLAALEARLGERIVLAQETPTRVAHRRADMVRQRWVEYQSVTPVDRFEGAGGGATRFEVVLRTQHGTYVKEAISGDDGQTRPSLGEIVNGSCRCIELDVLAILDEDGQGDAPIPPPPPSFGAGLTD
ncbi:MAG: tRNA pseudouridine(54/55) synthase Pus10 [Planctomycetota bacterium]